MAVKKNIQKSRKAFVQAKLKQTGIEATPEQKAKLRERFNTLSQSKEGRTKIVKVLGVAGTPQAQILRATLRNFPTTQTGNKTDTTKVDTTKSVVTNKGYIPGYVGVVNNVAAASNNAASSALIASSKYGVNITPLTGKVAESIGTSGKKYDTSGRKTTVIPTGKAPIVTDLGGSLRGMQGPSGFDPSTKNTVRAATAVAAVAALQSAAPAIIARLKTGSTVSGLDYYGSNAGSSSPKVPDSLTKQNTKELAKRALNFYKNLNK